ncbi:MAG: STAS domain-containing protein [Gammaproteobacteria bacterium SHHR-1]|uniref:STAS domain-containing protein n=1 Tax=Magnetovirga frankeli TaxID=947516 RepID=UPI001292DF4B|nr:STAS domain-containing protein [gamma proteobacterium SS-5]
MKRPASKELTRLSLGEEMTIYTAAQIKEDLLGNFNQSQGLELDLAQVQELDSSGVQLLMMLKRESKEKGKPLHLVNHSQAVIEVFELLDLSAHFGDPLVIPAEWQKP